MSAKQYIENVGITTESQLFASVIGGRSLHMYVEVKETPVVTFIVKVKADTILTTKHLSLALETYDSL